jgi:hypothetical protein
MPVSSGFPGASRASSKRYCAEKNQYIAIYGNHDVLS